MQKSAVPVPEEREAAARLALLNSPYELDENKHIIGVSLRAEQTGIPNRYTISDCLEILRELKHLKKLELLAVQDWIPGSEFKSLTELANLEEISIRPEEEGTVPQKLKGEAMRKFLESQPEKPRNVHF